MADSGSGGVLTDLTNAVVRASVTSMTGMVTSRPALLISDGKVVGYACDVNVGITTPYPNGSNQQIDDLYGVPGTRGYQVDDSLSIGTILNNVPLANNNSALLYADIGNPVTVTRTGTGSWMVTGFAAQMPGTRNRYPINLQTGVVGSVVNQTISGRLLTLAELGLYGGGFGICPFGSSGLFVGGTLVRIST